MSSSHDYVTVTISKYNDFMFVCVKEYVESAFDTITNVQPYNLQITLLVASFDIRYVKLRINVTT